MMIYIAGPYRGANSWEVEKNIRVAEGAGMAVAEMGHTPIIPHTMYRHFDGTLTADFWIYATMELAKRCDAILLCEGWKGSSGTLGEKAEMERLERPVFYRLEDIPHLSRQ